MAISMRQGSIAIAALLLFVPIFSGASASATADSLTMYSPTEYDSLLLMIYMSADAAGSPLNWSDDINEMESGMKGDNLTVIALVDGDGTGDTAVYEIRPDPADSMQILSVRAGDPPFLPPDNEANMGDPGTLSGFARYCIENYYDGGALGLIIWGHGSGWAGVAIDKSDFLTASELSSALREIDGLLTRPIDILVFDACAMGSVEFLSELSGLALLAVTSEIDIPTTGLPYDTILARISANLPMGDLEIAFSFADEYVKLSTLMIDTSAQAAVIDLGELGSAQEKIAEFSEIGLRFDPVGRDLFNETRDSCTSLESTGSIDAIEFFSKLSGIKEAPRKLSREALSVHESLIDAVLKNRVFISSKDLPTMQAESLKGIAIYFPAIPVSLENYGGTGTISKSWAMFLAAVMSKRWTEFPPTNMRLISEDLRYDDGLNDSLEIRWDETPELQGWEFEIYPSDEYEPILVDTVDDEAEMALFDFLTPGFYDLFAYGKDGDERYLNWSGFKALTISRLISIAVRLSDNIDISGATLIIRNLRTGETISFSVDSQDMLLSLILPEPYKLGDRLIVELCRNGTTLASGLLYVDEINLEVRLFSEPVPSSILMFLAMILVAFLLTFAMIRFFLPDKRERSPGMRRY